MSTRVTPREIMRGEVQDLFHQTFNLLESARRAVFTEAGKPDAAQDEEFTEKMGDLVGLLQERFEQLRSRVLPIIG